MTNGVGASGIAPRTYKSGSIIYFEGDKSEYIYVLKHGRVVLTSIKPESGEEVKEEVRQGEFFGVKSALGRYPRRDRTERARLCARSAWRISSDLSWKRQRRAQDAARFQQPVRA